MTKFEEMFKYDAMASDAKKANQLMDIDNHIWNQLGIGSGSELEASQSAQRNYLRLWREAVKRLHITSVGEKVALILEDRNFHSANEAIAIMGLSPKHWHPKTWNYFPSGEPNMRTGAWVRQPSGWWLYERKD